MASSQISTATSTDWRPAAGYSAGPGTFLKLIGLLQVSVEKVALLFLGDEHTHRLAAGLDRAPGNQRAEESQP